MIIVIIPLPIDQPTTDHAPPFARTLRGKISAGYNDGVVSQVAPNVAVYKNVNAATAAPYDL